MFDIVVMIFRLKLLVIVLAFTFCNSLFATQVNLHTSKRVSLIINKEDFVIITADSIFRITDKGLLVKAHNNVISDKHIQVFPVSGNSSYLINRGGGEILEFENDKIKKIDLTYQWNSRYNSFDFIKDKIIYSYGGYGYYGYHNNIIKFDTIKKDWSQLLTLNRSSKRNKAVIGLIINDTLTIALGKDNKLNPETGVVERVVSNKIEKYSFSKRVWHKHKLNSKVHRYFNTKGKDYIRIKNCDLPSVYNVNSELVTFDFNKQKVFFYSPKLENLSFIYKMMFNQKSRKFGFIYSIGGNKYFNQVDEKFMKANLTRTEYLYEKNFFDRPIFLIPTILIITLISIFYFFTFVGTKKPKNIFSDLLNDEEKKILDLLLQSKAFITYPILIDEMKFNLSYEARLKRLNKYLNDIEIKFKSEYRVGHNFFIIKKNTNDRRIKEIQIHPKSLVYLINESSIKG